MTALLGDPRIKLFITKERLSELHAALENVPPMFDTADFIAVDKHLDGDPYDEPVYADNFRTILKACSTNKPLAIIYDSEKTGRSERSYYPYKLSYSELNDKFRLFCAAFNTKTQKLHKVTLNLGRVVSVRHSDLPYRVATEKLCSLFCEPNENPPIILEITKERNSLQRFLLQFSSFDRRTEYNPARDIYTCHIFYDIEEETELLIRILSFGPTIKVLGPQSFLDQVKERIAKQIKLQQTRL